MSYLVLARKYRPSTFSEVVGQEHVTRTLGNAFASGRVHHAFLFCGPRGCGKTTLARIVGKALNCQNLREGPTAEPCGKCDACVSINNGSAVDYQEMDGASNRGIDAIRELTEAVRYQPAVLRKKVYVIDEVHMLTTEAFNALLKTLEEPPPHVTFVLATTEPHKLPNTILSRCQRYDFKLVPASRLAQHLASIFKQEKLTIEAGAISLVVRESGGSVRDALSLGDQIISYVGDATITEAHVAEVLGVADRSLTRTLVRSLASGAAGTALGAVESAIERGVDEVQLARAIVRYLRDLAVLQVAPDRPELVDASDEERTELVAEAAQLDRSRVTQMFDRMLRCCDELGKTLQPRLVLDCALIDVATIEPLVPLGDLIERLGDLEARIAGKGGARPTPGGGGGRSTPKTTVPQTPSSKGKSPGMSASGEAGSSPAGSVRAAGSTSSSAAGSAHAAASTSSGSAPGSAAGSASSASLAGSTGAPAGSAHAGSTGAPPVSTSSSAAGSAHAAGSTSSGSAAGSAHAAGSTSSGSAAGSAHAAGSTSSGSAAGSAHAAGSTSSGSAAGSAHAAGSTSSGSAAGSAHAAGSTSSGAAAGSARAAGSTSSAPVASASAAPSAPIHTKSAPVSMQPSGPVPKAESVASGSGPQQIALPTSSAEALVAWSKVIEHLENQKKMSLRGYFEFARVLKWTSAEVELGFADDDDSRWAGENAAERANIDDIRAVLADLGHKVKVSVRMLDASESKDSSARSIVESSRENKSAERSKREKEAREHPITKHVLQAFGASIKEIKTDV